MGNIFSSIGHLASDGWDEVERAPGDLEHVGKTVFHDAVNQAKSDWDMAKHAASDVAHTGEAAWHDTVRAATWTAQQLANPNSIVSQLGHTALDAVGEVPIVGSVSEGVNAVWYGAQGDYLDAGLSAASAIPGVGEGVDAMRLTKDGVRLAKDGETVVRDVHDGETIAKDARAGDAALTDASEARPPDPARTGGRGGDAEATKAPHNSDSAGPSDHAGNGGGGGGGAGAAKAPGGPTGDFYSVGYEMKLDPASYPGQSRGAHFQEANESLLHAMEGDPEFAQSMQDLGVNLERTPTGVAPRTSPDDWTWHHAQEPGSMQLVPRSQHQPGSIFQHALHPDGVGGYAIWGKQ